MRHKLGASSSKANKLYFALLCLFVTERSAQPPIFEETSLDEAVVKPPEPSKTINHAYLFLTVTSFLCKCSKTKEGSIPNCIEENVS